MCIQDRVFCRLLIRSRAVKLIQQLADNLNFKDSGFFIHTVCISQFVYANTRRLAEKSVILQFILNLLLALSLPDHGFKISQ